MVKAIFNPKIKTQKVWAGLYGGHYDVIVFFKKKPKPSNEEHNIVKPVWYDLMEQDKIIIGNMDLFTFRYLFPDTDLTPYTQKNGRPKDIEIPEVFEIELMAPFDDYGEMVNINTNLDGWNNS